MLGTKAKSMEQEMFHQLKTLSPSHVMSPSICNFHAFSHHFWKPEMKLKPYYQGPDRRKEMVSTGKFLNRSCKYQSIDQDC